MYPLHEQRLAILSNVCFKLIRSLDNEAARRTCGTIVPMLDNQRAGFVIDLPHLGKMLIPQNRRAFC